MSQVPERPAPVPADAVFEETTGQWVVGAFDASGVPLGAHRRYRNDGSLELACRYENGVLEGLFERFHPNGELARRGVYKDGVLDGEVEAFASTAPTDEPLRSCCVPPGAVRLEAAYDKGSCLFERFYDDAQRRLLSDGSHYPDRPSDLPKEAFFDEWSRRWYVGSLSFDQERQTIRYFSLDGKLVEERQTRASKNDGWLRIYSSAGDLDEETHYEAGLRSGPFRRKWPSPSPYADARIRDERGTMSADRATGLWEFFDERGEILRTADLGVAGIDVTTSRALEERTRSREGWREVARELATAHRTGEALLALARAEASGGDAASLRSALDDLRPPLADEAATAEAARVIEPSDASLEVLLDALVRGAEPAALLRGIASTCPRASLASLDLVNAAILLAPEWDQCRVTRSLVRLCMGNLEGAKVDAESLGEPYDTQREFLREYARVLYPKFDFWPVRVRFDALAADLPEEPCQPLSRIKEAIQKAATRLLLLRGALLEIVGPTPGWELPDVSGLLPRGPVPLERRTFRVALEDEEASLADGSEGDEKFEEVILDETLDLSRRDVASLMRLARSDWNLLTWLCWSAGLDRVALPDRLAPPANFSHAVGMAIERQWRAWDKLTTGGIMALTKGIRGFEWEGLDIDLLSPVLAEIAAHEFTDLRALFFYLCDDRQESPWQDNLRHG